MDYSTFGQPWQKRQVNRTRLPIRGNSMFIYTHYPENWELITMITKKGKTESKKDYWVPVLNCIRLTAGVNGVQMNGKHLDTSVARAQLMDGGQTILEPEEHDYIRVYPAHKGSYYCDRFTKIEQIGKRVVKTFQHEDFNLWRIKLVKDGYIKLPHPLLLKDVIEENQKILNRKGNKSHIPEQRKQMDLIAEKIVDMKTAITELEKNGVKCYA